MPRADAVLLGAVGGPKWDTRPRRAAPRAGTTGPAQGAGALREPAPGAAEPGARRRLPLREERIAGTDLLVVRELTGGIYFGDRGRDGDSAHDTCEYSADEIERIARSPSRRRSAAPGRGPRPASPRSTRPTCWRPRGCGARWSAASPPSTPTSSWTTCWSTRRDAAGLAPGRVRRDRHREHVRRHPHRRGRDARPARSACCPRRASATRAARPLRAGPRLGPGHRRPGHRQPARHHPLGGDDAAPRPRPGRRGRRIEAPSTRCSSAACARPTWRASASRTSAPTRLRAAVLAEAFRLTALALSGILP